MRGYHQPLIESYPLALLEAYELRSPCRWTLKGVELENRLFRLATDAMSCPVAVQNVMVAQLSMSMGFAYLPWLNAFPPVRHIGSNIDDGHLFCELGKVFVDVLDN